MGQLKFAIDLAPWFEEHQQQVRDDLARYYEGHFGDQFTGRWFDELAAMSDPDAFDALSLVAVEALAVRVPSEAAAQLLITRSHEFDALLRQVPKDVDLWEADDAALEAAGAADDALTALPGVGWVTAAKLLSTKRPQLVPVYDSKVQSLLRPQRGTSRKTMRAVLSEDGVRARVESVCAVPAVPQSAGLLRRIDVALWMHVTQH